MIKSCITFLIEKGQRSMLRNTELKLKDACDIVTYVAQLSRRKTS